MQLDKYERTDFNHDKFQIPIQKYQNKALLDQNLRIFIFAPKFADKQVRRRWIPTQKIPKSKIFGYKFKDYYFCTKLCNQANMRMLILKMAIVFKIPAQKHPNKTFWSQI